ncbi:MAG: hypothetical protein WC661_06640 [Opitutaceae bacterium]|jgi:hypothetical protein
MLKFIHGYNERFLPGLEKHGLLNKNSGLKLTQHFATPENEKFNRLAAKGGTLHNRIRETGGLFYIDRLQGGTFYSKYDFDPALLREYRDMLGEGFLGIQMHEWGDVLDYDWTRIRKQLANTPPPWTEQQIHEAIKAVSACQWCIHLSCGTPLEYSQKQYAKTLPDYVEEMRQLFKLRQAETGGLLLACDSFCMAPAMEYDLGGRTVMPEVGDPIPLMRLQVAMARGMSGALKRHWGVYYQPWGGKPFSAPHFFETPENEWRLDNSIFPYDFTANGPNGGSSRSLQRRIYYYALLSGADYLSEEWGVSNTFHDWRDYPLTPYGEIKKEFITFAEAHPDLKPFIPFAIVLPREFEAIDLRYINDAEAGHYLGRELDAGVKAAFEHLKGVLRLIYARTGTGFGNEGHIITNSRFGDFFDVIHEDAGEEAFSKYTWLVDAGREGAFARSASAAKHKVLESADVDQLKHRLEAIIDAEFPCMVSGGAHWLLNRCGDKRLLSLFNNEGVERTVEKGDVLIAEAEITAIIRFKNKPASLRILKGTPEITLTKKDDGTYGCKIPAGGFAVIEL